MTRNPDSDIEARRLDLQLEQANLDVHRLRWARAEHWLERAEQAMAGIPDPADVVSRLLFAQTAAQITTANAQLIDSGLILERASQQAAHESAHIAHYDESQGAIQEARSGLQSAMEQVAEEMRAKGIDVSLMQGPGGIMGLSIGDPNQNDPDR